MPPPAPVTSANFSLAISPPSMPCRRTTTVAAFGTLRLGRHAPDRRAEHDRAADERRRARILAEGKKHPKGPRTTSSMLISPASADGMSLAPSMKVTKPMPIVVSP